MSIDLKLLPMPRQLKVLSGSLQWENQKMILINTQEPQQLLFAARLLQEAVRETQQSEWNIAAGFHIPPKKVGASLIVDPGSALPNEGYRLKILSDGIFVTAKSPHGIFYAVCTLKQILSQFQGSIPCLDITDWPDFPVRGVMLDISRDKVPQMKTLYELVDLLASWKINQFQLYIEHTFAYTNHPAVWEESSPMTGQEIMELDRYCKDRFIELVPNQNSFGHMHRWLDHPEYAHLAETLEEFSLPWGGTMKGPFSLAAVNPDSVTFMQSLYDELLPYFSSKTINVGCDETFDLGTGQSRAACEKLGTGRVYLNYLLKIYEDIKRRGYTMQFWGDILVQHPELVPEVPKDLVALIWGYEANHPFDKQLRMVSDAGMPFYVCPGTSSWTTIAGRTDNVIGNLLNAAEQGIKHGAQGYLTTDWGDLGHWQMLPVSYLGFAVVAAFSWCLEANRQMAVEEVVSLFAFEDPTGSMGCLVYHLGNVYRKMGFEPPNGSALFWLLQLSEQKVREYLPRLNMQGCLEAIDEAMANLPDAKMKRPDADLIQNEFLFTADLLKHAYRRAHLLSITDQIQAENRAQEMILELEQLILRYRQLWLARNREGGLADSVARFERLLDSYRQ